MIFECNQFEETVIIINTINDSDISIEKMRLNMKMITNECVAMMKGCFPTPDLVTHLF